MKVWQLLLSAHLAAGLVLASSMASAASDESQSVEELLKELTDGELRGNPFSLFARRASLVITGLVHISILLLPKSQEGGEPDAAPQAQQKARSQQGQKASSSGSSKAGGAGSSKDAGASGGSDPREELRAAGWPADSSDPSRWEQVQSILDRTATGGLDWDNCCVYRITEEGGATVQPAPSYPLSCTAAYHAGSVAKDVVVSNEYESKGPHFADWRRLYEMGARSMAAAPMCVQQRIVGVLSLASREPNAFERCRLVWLLAMVLAPFVSALKYTSQAMEMEGFIARIMPPLLEQNYLRNMAPAAFGANGKGSSKPQREQAEQQQHAAQQSSSATSVASPQALSAGSDMAAADTGQPPALTGSGDQFAQNAEVLITATAAGAVGQQPNMLAPSTPTVSADLTSRSPAHTNGLPPSLPAADQMDTKGAGLRKAPAAANGARLSSYGRAGRVNGRSAGKPAGLAAAISNSLASNGMPGGSLPDAHNSTSLAGSGSGEPLDPYSLSGSATESDLDWGDFFFNLISMCIVYAYFSEAAVAGESQAAILVSMCIAAVDILLLALRWLWYEQYITAGGAVLQAFQAYRLLVLPVANTWMSWSLLNKLGITPGTAAVAAIGCIVLGCLLLGVQMRFFLHAPLQLASVLFAASSTSEVCSRFFASTTGLGCMSAVSLVQLSIGVFVPALMVQVLDARSADKPYHLPHVQAKRWLLQS